MAPTVNNLGGKMYGDGEYVCEFENASSDLCPTTALLLSPSGQCYTTPLQSDEQANIATARKLILIVRAKEGALS